MQWNAGKGWFARVNECADYDPPLCISRGSGLCCVELTKVDSESSLYHVQRLGENELAWGLRDSIFSCFCWCLISVLPTESPAFHL